MKHFILLMASLFILATFESCHQDNPPKQDHVTLQLTDYYQGSCAGELLNMRVHITVNKYSYSGNNEGVYWSNEFDTSNTQHIFNNIPIPHTGKYTIEITLLSNDCVTCCHGISCDFNGGRPYFGTQQGLFTAPADGTVVTMTPLFMSCE